MADINEQVSLLNKNVETVVETSKAAKTIAEATSTKQAEMLDQLKELNAETTAQAAWRKEAEEMTKKDRDAVNQLITEVKTMREGGVKMIEGPGKDFASSLAKGLKANKDKMIETVSSGGRYKFALEENTGLHVKAAANMILPTNLTGDSVFSYIPTPVILPRQLVNFRDLVPGIQTATGHIVVYREDYNGGVSPSQGAFGIQTTQGSLKEQVGYTFTNVPFVADYIAGFVRIAKQMLQDLPFLSTYLPSMLLRDYYKKENAVFYAAQVAAALGTHTAGGNAGETFINDIANLETANFAPNGIVMPPLVWANLMKSRLPSTGTSYSWPGGIYMTPSGDLAIAGIPIIKATWVTANTALIADWTQSQVATVDGLKVEFFEQDLDNVERNLITVRVEARVVLVTGQPYAFVNATSGLGTGA